MLAEIDSRQIFPTSVGERRHFPFVEEQERSLSAPREWLTR